MHTFIILWLFLNCFLNKCAGNHSSLQEKLFRGDFVGKNTTNGPIPYIYGGKEVNPPHKYPFMVLIEMPDSFCGGSLISEQYVLSAAHCLPKNPVVDESGEVDEETVRKMTVGVGVHDKSQNYRKLSIAKILRHPSYERDDKQDIMLIKLRNSVKSFEKVAPINLPETKELEKAGTELVVTGWGANDLTDISRDVLLETTVKIWSDAKCTGIFSPSNGTLCAGGNGKTACEGDSGGPLFGKREGKYYLIGIVSVGIECGTHPDRFTRVSYFKQWIEETMNSRNASTFMQ